MPAWVLRRLKASSWDSLGIDKSLWAFSQTPCARPIAWRSSLSSHVFVIYCFCLEDEKDIQDIYYSIGHSFFSVLCPHWRPGAIGHGCMYYGSSLVAFSWSFCHNASGFWKKCFETVLTTVATALDQEKGDSWVPLSATERHRVH
jgi:hypothetical protein